jgi:hypothetical protein
MTIKQVVFTATVLVIAFGRASSLAGTAADGQRQLFHGSELPHLLVGKTLVSQDKNGLFWIYYPTTNTLWGRTSGGDVDIGRWWVENDCYCRAWRRWFQGATRCWQFAAVGTDGLMWLALDGSEIGLSLVQQGNAIGEMAAPADTARADSAGNVDDRGVIGAQQTRDTGAAEPPAASAEPRDAGSDLAVRASFTAPNRVMPTPFANEQIMPAGETVNEGTTGASMRNFGETGPVETMNAGERVGIQAAASPAPAPAPAPTPGPAPSPPSTTSAGGSVNAVNTGANERLGGADEGGPASGDGPSGSRGGGRS